MNYLIVFLLCYLATLTNIVILAFIIGIVTYKKQQKKKQIKNYIKGKKNK